MKLPWVRRAALEAAENLRRHALEQLASSEVLRQQLGMHLEEMRSMLAAEKSASEQERRRLMDRVCRLSGQPPLYETEAAAPAPVAAAESKPIDPKVLARVLPSTQVTFKSVHEAARTAMAEGRFDPEIARIRG